MGKRVALVGDFTSTGGKILTGDQRMTFSGMPAALLGDKVSCPKCQTIGTIIEGASNWNVHGKPVAYDGCVVSCACRPIGSHRIVATNSLMFVDVQSVFARNKMSLVNYSTPSTQYSESFHCDHAVGSALTSEDKQKEELYEEVEAYLITTYGYMIDSLSLNEIGDHSALYIRIKGKFPFLYDQMVVIYLT